MSNPETIIHTHAPRQALSRLTLYRLKRARADYRMAAAELEDRYQEQVRAILSNDRQATADLRQKIPANYRFNRKGSQQPSLAIANTFDNELSPYPGTPAPWWLVSIKSLLMRNGYKPAGKLRLGY